MEEEIIEEIEEEEYDETIDKEESSEESDDDEFNINDLNRGIIAGAGAMWGYDPKKRLPKLTFFLNVAGQRRSKSQRNQKERKKTRLVVEVRVVVICLLDQSYHNNPNLLSCLAHQCPLRCQTETRTQL